MTTDSAVGRTSEARAGTSPHWRSATVLLGALLVLVVSGWALTWVAGDRAASQSGPEVGFARDMSVHHEQAVVMSFLVRQRTDDPDVGTFAMEIAQGQANQQGRMLAWLDASGVPAPTGDYEPMAWMAAPGADGQAHGHTAAPEPADGVDPMIAGMGMATDDQLGELAGLDGVDAEVLYLQLMFRHHQGGLEMAQAFLERSDEPALTRLAEAVVVTQDREIDIITDLLESRGAGVPDA